MDMLKTTFFFIGFFFLSWSCLCESRRFGPLEKKLEVNQDHLITKNNEEITKLEAPLTNETTKTILNQENAAVVSHGDHINGQHNEKNTKKDRRVKRGSSQAKTTSSSKRSSSSVSSRTWKVPKYSKKQPRSDQEHPGFNLDYMQPTTHPPHHN